MFRASWISSAGGENIIAVCDPRFNMRLKVDYYDRIRGFGVYSTKMWYVISEVYVTGIAGIMFQLLMKLRLRKWDVIPPMIMLPIPYIYTVLL